MPRLHLSCKSRRFAANGVRLPKGAAFGRAKIVCIVLTISFELTKEIVEREGEPCRSPSFDGSAAVSPLCASSRQGAMAGGALRLPPCPLRLPLLFPKNLAALRFSGALFIFRAHLYQNRAAFTSIRMLIRETKQNAILPRFEYYLE